MHGRRRVALASTAQSCSCIIPWLVLAVCRGCWGGGACCTQLQLYCVLADQMLQQQWSLAMQRRGLRQQLMAMTPATNSVGTPRCSYFGFCQLRGIRGASDGGFVGGGCIWLTIKELHMHCVWSLARIGWALSAACVQLAQPVQHSASGQQAQRTMHGLGNE
jgi:hypothetical protein